MELGEELRRLFSLRGNFPALATSDMVSNTGWNMFEVVWQPYVLSLGATIPILGSLTGMQTAIRSGLQLITGRVSDCVGRKSLLVSSYSLSLVGIFLSLLARSWIFLIPTIFIFSVSGALWEPVFPTMISESSERDERGTAFSLMSLTWFLPGFYAPALAGYLAERYGFRHVLGILLLTELSASIVFTAYIKETLKRRRALDLRHLLSSLREVLIPRFGLSKFYAVVIIDRFSWAIGEGIFFGMLMKTFNITVIQWGIMSSVFSVVVAASQMPMGKLVDRHGRRLFLIVSRMIWLFVLVGYLVSKGFLGFLLCQGFLGLAVSTWIPAFNAYVSNAVPEEERGRLFGDLNCLMGLTSFPAPVLGAFLYESYGFNAPILASLILSFLVSSILVTIGER